MVLFSRGFFVSCFSFWKGSIRSILSKLTSKTPWWLFHIKCIFFLFSSQISSYPKKQAGVSFRLIFPSPPYFILLWYMVKPCCNTFPFILTEPSIYQQILQPFPFPRWLDCCGPWLSCGVHWFSLKRCLLSHLNIKRG